MAGTEGEGEERNRREKWASMREKGEEEKKEREPIRLDQSNLVWFGSAIQFKISEIKFSLCLEIKK